ncbi:helix-turn-helix transcriptional regulator [Microbacterium sp. Cr-K29]|uniref:helix-turn-helix transcriptional regulator n=1 Tax=Microbacterium sp. Cr-K29 TaxID=1452534 RepID=UPI00049358B3|nr:helix-turn-helix domain-containing protein [Microbacterium sp. Cr-K29]
MTHIEPNSKSALPRLLTIDELAAYLDVPRRTLDGWRARKVGPPFVKFGKSVRYPEHALLRWMDACMNGDSDV